MCFFSRQVNYTNFPFWRTANYSCFVIHVELLLTPVRPPVRPYGPCRHWAVREPLNCSSWNFILGILPESFEISRLWWNQNNKEKSLHGPCVVFRVRFQSSSHTMRDEIKLW
jgi:hypothetical protein